jgi:DNA-directed RNA polymerase delta subunit
LKLLDKSVNNLSQRLDKLYPDINNNNSDGINYWKGRKIIPLDKWLKITKANTISQRENYNVKEGLQYFPDNYFESMFPLGISEDLKEEANKCIVIT